MPISKDEHQILLIDNNGNGDLVNEKKFIFASEYVKNRNGTKSALLAGYSPKTAYAIANTLLKDVEVKNYIRAQSENIIQQIGIEQEKIAREYARLGFSDVTDFLNDDYSLKTKDQLNKTKTAALKSIKVRKKVTTSADGSKIEESDYSLQTHDKLKALDRLAEMSGMINNDQQPTQINNFVNSLTNVFK